MTDPLQALESLVGKMHEAGSKGDAVVGRAWLTKYADELEPIIRQLRTEFGALRITNEAWDVTAAKLVAEVESLRAERERYREALEVADGELGFVYEELQWATTLAAHDVLRHALQASSPTPKEPE